MVALPTLLLLRLALRYLVMGLPMLFTTQKAQKAFEKSTKDPNIVRIWGFLTLLVGLLFLLVQYVFNDTWYLIFAIIGRLSLIKGVVFMWFPSYIARKIGLITKSVNMARVMGIVAVVLAAFLTWVAIVKI